MIFTSILFFLFIGAVFVIRYLAKRVKELEIQLQVKQIRIDKLELNDAHMDRLRQPFMEGYLKELSKKE